MRLLNLPVPAIRPTALHLFVAGAFIATVGACGEAGGRPSGPVVTERDSAGVRIVELSDVYLNSLPEWSLEPSPHLVIGAVAGPPESVLFRVVGATALGDGSIVVANAGTGEVRVFDGTGQHVRTFGRAGQGPGEFARLSFLGRIAGDTLVTFDTNLRRATWFTDHGEVVRTVGITPWTGEPDNATYGVLTAEVVGVVEQQLLVRGGYFRRTGEGEYRDTFSLAVADTGGSVVARIGQYPGLEMYYGRLPSGVTAAQSPIFGRETHVAVAAGRLVVGSTERFELDVYDGASLRMKVIAGTELAPVTASEVETWRQYHRDSASELTGEFGEIVRRVIDEVPARSTPPVFQQLAVDRDRSIWVAEPHRVPDGSSRWIVLAADGTPWAQVEIPPDLTIFEIGEDYVLGLRRDGQEVEQVVLYRLHRG